jgi:RNA polymerase sigma-70 factor (TIGR02960 family)
VTSTVLGRAQAGDEDAFRELTDPYRRELEGHCYRLLGSAPDAEDMLQEVLLAAWRGLDRFEERASVRAWLYRIATNRCLNALRDAGRRPRPAQSAVPRAPEPTRREPAWFGPAPDTLLEGLPDGSPGPEARYEARESLALAFVAGLAHLPPRQRAVLVLRDSLGFPAAEVAGMLDSSEVSVNSALARARTALAARVPAGGRERAPLPRSARERELVGRFVDAFERADVQRVVALLTDDAWLTMPPVPLQYQGGAAISRFYLTRGWWRPGQTRLAPTRANGQPALGYYVRDPATGAWPGHGLIVLTLACDRISAITRFGGDGLLPRFGLPAALPA